ncbi:hypothetical protein [uncultured Caulobacter sp.]|uniref:hypothetical protein n=1 Tax=uncultured Caulobacter sp. TaxID=158749 RepID=UPI00261E326B|nr:hypothetical protein [uncultured Caulobacter sp.]
MSDKLDQLFTALRDQPLEALPDLEGRVWARIDSWRERRRAASALAPLRAASVVAALGLGVVGGSLAANAAARTPPEISAFAVDVHLAPSTLLVGR